MIDVQLLRDNPDSIRDALRRRGVEKRYDVDALATLEGRHRAILRDVEELRRLRNEASEKVAAARQQKDDVAANQLIADMQAIKGSLQELEAKLEEAGQTLNAELVRLPNIPFDDVPKGHDPSHNKVVREWGKKPTFSFTPRDHADLGEALGIIDLERASKVSGARFVYLKGDGALLELALIQLAFGELTAKGFIPVIPPAMIREQHFRGMGRLAPGDEDERYYLPHDNLYLAGSAEHTIGPMHAGEILKGQDLPLRYVGFSSCFRREAGSYGKDTKGMLRVHQFDKVEMFSYTTPEKSEEEHRFLLSCQERLMQALVLPHRVVEMCAGDLGFTDARQFDIETWMPGLNEWKETHSASNTTDFQARGENVRYKPAGGKAAGFAHMLNATALAIGRTIVAIVENNQQKDGSVAIPGVLRPWMGGKDRIALKEH